MKHVVRTLVAAGPDAIQLSVGLAPLLQSQPGRDKPALVLRSDVANVYGPSRPPSRSASWSMTRSATGSGLPGKRLKGFEPTTFCMASR
jgi:DhnA family fructose-bisphosphate aldolase class Ia